MPSDLWRCDECAHVNAGVSVDCTACGAARPYMSPQVGPAVAASAPALPPRVQRTPACGRLVRRQPTGVGLVGGEQHCSRGVQETAGGAMRAMDDGTEDAGALPTVHGVLSVAAALQWPTAAPSPVPLPTAAAGSDANSEAHTPPSGPVRGVRALAEAAAASSPRPPQAPQPSETSHSARPLRPAQGLQASLALHPAQDSHPPSPYEVYCERTFRGRAQCLRAAVAGGRAVAPSPATAPQLPRSKQIQLPCSHTGSASPMGTAARSEQCAACTARRPLRMSAARARYTSSRGSIAAYHAHGRVCLPKIMELT